VDRSGLADPASPSAMHQTHEAFESILSTVTAARPDVSMTAR